jgi:hypothetical protein
VQREKFHVSRCVERRIKESGLTITDAGNADKIFNEEIAQSRIPVPIQEP